MNRKIYYWKLRNAEMQLGERPLIMGVLNVTPDSFSDGGRFNDPDRAYARALELEEQGADIIDIGAESTKPGSHRITADEEWQRLVPVLKRLRGNLRAPLSLDTYKSEIAERALDYGVEIFNDPSGLTFDPHLAKVAAIGNAGLILNHMRGLPESWAKQPPMQDPVGTIARELEATASRARHAGVEKNRIVIDPGLGFGKRKEQNAEILAHLQQLAALDYPILVGPSRKSFLAQNTENATLYATAAAVTAAVLNGAHIVRVHDVKEMLAVVQVAGEIAKASIPVTPPHAEEKPAGRSRTQAGPNFEAEKPRPPRPPIAKPPVVEPTPAETTPVEAEAAKPEFDAGPEDTAGKEGPAEKKEPVESPASAPVTPRRVFARPRDEERANQRESRPSRPSYPDRERQDRDRGDGSRPPFARPPASRPFTPRRPADQAGPPRGRDFRPGQGAAAGNDRFKPSGFKPGGFKSDGPKKSFGPPKSFGRDGERPPRREDRGDYRPSGPRSGPPRSGPPRGDRPSGPPRSFEKGSFDHGSDSRGRGETGGRGDFGDRRPPFRGKRDDGPSRSGPPRSGPPRSGPPRSGPARGDRRSDGPSGPPKRPFRKRP